MEMNTRNSVDLEGIIYNITKGFVAWAVLLE